MAQLVLAPTGNRTQVGRIYHRCRHGPFVLVGFKTNSIEQNSRTCPGCKAPVNQIDIEDCKSSRWFVANNDLVSIEEHRSTCGCQWNKHPKYCTC